MGKPKKLYSVVLEIQELTKGDDPSNKEIIVSETPLKDVSYDEAFAYFRRYTKST